MCGIFAYAGRKKNAGAIVLNGLKQLEYRGYDSWGIAIQITNYKLKIKNLWVKKRVGKIGEAKADKFPSGSMAIGHTRWATHGAVTLVNAHPQLDCQQRLALIHNGIIENYQELRRRLKQRHHFVSETDTEVLLHLIEEINEKKPFPEAVRLAFKQAGGLNAVIVFDSQTETLVAAKTGSPLVIGLGQGENFIASDLWSLLPHTRKVFFLEDGQMATVTSRQVVLKEIKAGKEIKVKPQLINWQVEQSQLGKYPHFMIKEISEQPQVIDQISATMIDQAGKLARLIKKSSGTFIVGCGTAAYAGLAGQYLFSQIAGRHINPAVGSEFTYHADFLTERSLVMALSQSGETIDIIESVQLAKKKKARVAALVNVLGSTLYRLADFKILLNAGPEKCVLATKSLTAKLAVLILTAEILSGQTNQGRELLKKASQEVSRLLKPANLNLIKKLAAKIYQQRQMFVIGRGLSYPAALEAALKIKEASYLHAEGFASGELKHGVIALIEKGTPCLVFAPEDETYAAVISGAMELKARGALIIAVSPKNNEVFDFHLAVKDCAAATIIPNVVVSQLLGYYLALKKGLDPDKPRNLAKSVTVK